MAPGTINQNEVQARLEAARTWAVEAGNRTLDLFQQRGLRVDRKQDRTPVTDADRQAEQYLRQQIRRQFPDDGIVGEEFGVHTGHHAVRWILDPIDGTKSFISGVPLYGTLVGVEVDDRPQVGVIYIPALQEGAYAIEGGGAFHFRGSESPKPARVSSCQHLTSAVVVTSEIEAFNDRDAMSVCQALLDGADFLRTWGDCYGYLLVATGRVDLMIDPLLSIWDAAAVAPIIREAGGLFCDWAGEDRIDAGEAIGTSPGLLDDVLAITRPLAGQIPAAVRE